jgi:hypothetical protein
MSKKYSIVTVIISLATFYIYCGLRGIRNKRIVIRTRWNGTPYMIKGRAAIIGGMLYISSAVIFLLISLAAMFALN